MNHHYFRADMEEWEITTVVTVMTLAFDVKTLMVRIIDEGLIHMYYSNSIHDWLIIAIKVNKIEKSSFSRTIIKTDLFRFKEIITKHAHI